MLPLIPRAEKAKLEELEKARIERMSSQVQNALVVVSLLVYQRFFFCLSTCCHSARAPRSYVLCFMYQQWSCKYSAKQCGAISEIRRERSIGVPRNT